MSEKNYWLKNGLLNLFQNASGVILGFLSFYMLVRVLTKDDYGLWVIFLSLTGIVDMAKNGFTQEATIKYLASADINERKKITTASFTVNLIITLGLVIILIFIAPYLGKLWHSHELVTMLYLYIIVFFATIFLGQFNYIEQANLRFNGVFAAAFVRQFLFFLFILICYLANRKISLTSLAIVQIINVLIATFLAYLYSRRDLHFSRKLDKKWLKKIFDFGKYTFGVSVTSVLGGSIDQMMLGSMLSKAASGSFNVAVRITSLTSIPAGAMASIIFPQTASRIETHGIASAKYLYEKSVGVILGILVPIIIILYLFADYAIIFIAGDKFSDSIPLLKITLLTCIFGPFISQAGPILTAAGKTKVNFYIMLFNISTLVILNLFFIKEYGVIGAAYALLINSIMCFITTQFILKKVFDVNWLNCWKYTVAFYPEFIKKYLSKKAN